MSHPLSRAELAFRAMLAAPPKTRQNPRPPSVSPEYSLWARRARAAWEARSICWWHQSLGRWLMRPPFDCDPDDARHLRGLVSAHPEALNDQTKG